MFDRILLAIDASPASEMATAFAGALAAAQGGSVHVFHVNEYLVNGGGVTLATRDQASALVAGAMSELRDTGVRVSGSSCLSSYRQVPQRIAAAALEHGAECIVLGSRRHRRLGRLFSFQVRERTTRLSALPVLTAPAPLSAMDGGLSLQDLALAEVNHRLASPTP